MKLRAIDLDGSLRTQTLFLQRLRPQIHDFRSWGPQLRLCCGFRRFAQFETALAAVLGSAKDDEPTVSHLGSGDFHHVTLAMLRRIRRPFNLLVLDNHPDWVRGIPFLHCGTWLNHAAQLPEVRTIFHIGGNVDFDNRFQWLAPWKELRAGKIKVISAIRPLRRGRWNALGCPALRVDANVPAGRGRIDQLLAPLYDELAKRPLYVSLDKDVMTKSDAVVNWDSGQFALEEVKAVLKACLEAADYQLAGMDIVGDWSPVRLCGWGRRIMHLTEHSALQSNLVQAARCNEKTNLSLLQYINDLLMSDLAIRPNQPAPARANRSEDLVSR